MIKSCPKCGSENISHCEYTYNDPNHYDGWSEMWCHKCGVRLGRWTGKVLKDGESEVPPGGTRKLTLEESL